MSDTLAAEAILTEAARRKHADASDQLAPVFEALGRKLSGDRSPLFPDEPPPPSPAQRRLTALMAMHAKIAQCYRGVRPWELTALRPQFIVTEDRLDELNHLDSENFAIWQQACDEHAAVWQIAQMGAA